MIEENILNQCESSLDVSHSRHLSRYLIENSHRIGAIHQVDGTSPSGYSRKAGLQMQYLHSEQYNWLQRQRWRPCVSRKARDDESLFVIAVAIADSNAFDRQNIAQTLTEERSQDSVDERVRARSDSVSSCLSDISFAASDKNYERAKRQLNSKSWFVINDFEPSLFHRLKDRRQTCTACGTRRSGALLCVSTSFTAL